MSNQLLVVGGAGSQAAGFLRAFAQAETGVRIVAVDRAWTDRALADNRRLRVEVRELDIVQDGAELVALAAGSDLVANFAGPFHELGSRVLDACLEAGTDYLDICDDMDATTDLLSRSAQAERRGVTALIGMGSAPGMTNVLVRLALDCLPPRPAQVQLMWTVDAADMRGAVIRHFLHSFVSALPGSAQTPGWEDLTPTMVDFPQPVGRQLVVRLSHPETMTLPRFTRAVTVENYGGLIPAEFTHLGWLTARLWRGPGGESDPAIAQNLYEQFDAGFGPRHRRVGSGLMVDVTVDGTGYRYVAGDVTTQEDATGIPAAAGALLALQHRVPGPGVVSPETVSPALFFQAVRRVSAGGGGLTAYDLRDGAVGERVGIRQLLQRSSGVE